MYVGSLMGKGGKTIKQMTLETKTQIRAFPRNRHLPRCVSVSEEIVQVEGDVNAVRRAVEMIPSCLKEKQLDYRGHFHGRAHLPDQFCPPDDDLNPHINSKPRLSSLYGSKLGSPSSAGTPNLGNNSYGSRTSDYAFDSRAGPIADNQSQKSVEDLVFRILCPVDKLDRVMGQDSGIIETLWGDVSVDVRVSETIPGSDEQIIIITSKEGPDHELFPAQKALLHIQSQIADLGHDKDDIVTTRLLVPTSEIGCLDGLDGSLSEIRTGADIHILPREEHPACVPEDDELIQIVGEKRAARLALVEVTKRLRKEFYWKISFLKDLLSPSTSPTASDGSMSGPEAALPSRIPSREGFHGSDTAAVYQDAQTVTTTRPSKEAGVSSGGTLDRNNGNTHDDVPNTLSRLAVQVVTRRTLEVVLPEHAFVKLIMRSGKKLAQISELSRTSIRLIEDRPDQTEKIIQISGTAEQLQKAENLFLGFILSAQEVDDSS